MLCYKKAFVQISVLLLALAATPKLLVSFSSSLIDPVLAQSSNASPIFPLPKSLPSGTTVRVDGSKSMRVINEALKKRFIEKFPDSKIELTATGSDEALAALLKGDINLAAIGRPLTDKEKAQGLVAVPVSREKIAIIVGSDNPFSGNLTFEQFARIFRGEITDWSQVGGTPGAIRFIDHPDYSDTRRSLSTYDTFKKVPFKTGSSAIRVSQDDSAAIVKELGKDGISYAIADQVIDLKNVRVIPMHKTMPDDPRYPYSQPRGYVYRKETSELGVLSFLGFATSAQGQGIVEVAKDQEVEAVRKSVTTAPGLATSPEATSPSPTLTTSGDPAPTGNASATSTASTDRDFPWWLLLLLLIPLGGGLLWWLLKGSGGSSDAPESSPPTPGTTPTVPPETTGVAATTPGTVSTPVTPGFGGTNEAGTSGIATTAGTNVAAATPEVAPETNSITSAASGSSDAVVSEPAAISSTAASGIAGAAGALAGITGAGIAAGVAALAGRSGRSQITLVPRDNQHILAHWEVPQADRDWAQQQGGQQFQLRIYEVTGINLDSQPANNIQIYDCDELSQERQVAVPVGNRDYIAEIGYITLEGQWLQLARSNSVWVPSSVPSVETAEAALSGGATALATGAIQSPAPTETKSRLVLSARDNQQVYAQWEVPQADREWARQQGGQQFQLRIYEVTGINLDSQPADNMQSYECDEFSQEWQVPVPIGDRDYVAEIGYITLEGQWLQLARSNSVWLPSSVPSVETAEAALSGGATALATGAIQSPAPTETTSRLVLSARDNQQVYAQWEVSPADTEWARQQGGQQFQLRICEVTGIDLDSQPADNMQSYECDEFSQQWQASVPVGDRDYIAEIGYITLEGQWLQLARSNSVWVSAPDLTEPSVETTEAALIGGATAIASGVIEPTSPTTSRLVLSARDNQQVYVYWEVPQADREWARQQGGQQFQLRICEVTGINLLQTYECDEFSQERQVPVPIGDRDYVAEIGYITVEGQWLQLARSNSVWVPSSVPSVETAEAALSGGATALATGVIEPTSPTATTSHLVLTARDNQQVYAQWEVPQADREWAKQQGGQQFQLRIYEVTGINLDTQPAHNIHFYDCDELSQERQVEVLIGNHDYVAEIGYITLEGQWLQLARSNSVWVPSSVPSVETAEAALSGGATALTTGAIQSPAPTATGSRLVVSARDNQQVYVYWEVPQADREWARQQGGQQFQLRIYEVTGINLDIQPAHNLHTYDCDELTQERQVQVPVGDRDYIAEIGYITVEGQWLQLARSNSVWVSAPDLTEPSVETTEAALIGGATALATGAIQSPAPTATGSRLVVSARENQQVYVYWEVSQADREWAKQQGGRQFQLRIYEVTGINLDIEPAHNLQTYECDELEQERLVAVPVGDRDYIAEIGYITLEGQWLQLVRSNSVWLPSSVPSVETTEAAWLGGATAIATGAIQSSAPTATVSHLVLTARDNQQVYAQWEVSPADREWARQQGGQQFQLRIYEVTGINLDTQPAHNIHFYDCDELSQERQVEVLIGNHDYVAEIGYITLEGQWLQLARSNSVQMIAPDWMGVAGTIPPPAPRATVSHLVLTARDNQNLYVYWEVSQADQEAAKQRGGRQFQLRIYEVTGINLDTQPAHNMQSYECDELEQERQVQVTVGDRYYVAEIGYITLENQWLQLVRSNCVWVSASASLEPTAQTTGAIQSPAPTATTSRLVLSARDNQQVYAQWEVPQADTEWARQQGGRQFQLRIYEVTGINLDSQPANNLHTYDCDELSQERQVQVTVGDRDYIAEIGYITVEGEWLQLARSNSVWVPSSVPSVETAEAALISGATAIATGAIQSPAPTATTSRLMLSARDNQQVYAYWEVSQADREWARQQGGQQFQLRIYEVTGIDLDSQPAHSLQTYECDEFSQQWQASVPVGDRDYIAEIGHITFEGQWLQFARSNSVWVSASDLTKPSLETGEVTLAGEAVTSQKAVELPREPLPVEEPSRVAQREGCKIQHLTVHSRNHCFALDSERMRILQETAVSKTLEPGIHVVRIKSGTFGYSSNVNQPGQPIVLFWIYGGKVINKKTNVPVGATWSTLNGYNDTLTLEVVETATLCAFFFDTYLDDNDGEVTVSVARLYPN